MLDHFISMFAGRAGYACGVRMQETPTGKQPLAYYSTKQENIEAGLPLCYKGLAEAVFAFQKASETMGHQTTCTRPIKYMPYSLALTQARKTRYEVVPSAPELRIQCCNTVNPETQMVIPVDGSPHDCLQATRHF